LFSARPGGIMIFSGSRPLPSGHVQKGARHGLGHPEVF
jgi:hypothetical protein